MTLFARYENMDVGSKRGSNEQESVRSKEALQETELAKVH